MDLELTIEFPLDDDGYIRRQCPRCERVFKWHHDPDPEEAPPGAEPALYHCPYCGEPSPADQWLTDEQVDYAQAAAANELMKQVESQLRPSVEGLNRAGGGLIRADLDVPHRNPPAPLFEPNDMVAVEPPCHPEEPIKVIEDSADPIHCLICGKSFLVGWG